MFRCEAGRIKNPIAPSEALGVIETAETSVSTSADYYNFLIAGDKQYGHILDPRTLQPATLSLSVTIVSRDGTLADAMSKAAFVLGPRAGLALVESFPGTTAVIVYRKPDGATGVMMSDALVSAYHPVTR
jgi:thiamine biosynthesis lipoprotein